MSLPNEDLYPLPRRLDGYTILDLVTLTSNLLIEKPSDSENEADRRHYIVHDVDPDITVKSLGQSEKPRILLVTEMETHIHQISHGAGAIVQAFTVFPRERLIVETTSTSKEKTTDNNTKTVIDSADIEDEKSFSTEIMNEESQKDSTVTSWQAKAKGGLGAWSISAGTSSSRTQETVARDVSTVLQKQARRASRARKVEVKVHRELIKEGEKTYKSERTIYNPNFDSPMDVYIHESIGHYVYVTQITSQILIYQSIDQKKEIRKDIRSEKELERFVKQVVIDDDENNLKKLIDILTDALKIRRKTETDFRTYNPFKENLKYKPEKEYKYLSYLSDRTHILKVFGVIVDVNELQLPSGDVIGRVRLGKGDARGNLSKTIHDASTQQMKIRNEIASVQLDSIAILKKKVETSRGDDAQEWGKLLVESLKNLDIDSNIDAYYGSE